MAEHHGQGLARQRVRGVGGREAHRPVVKEVQVAAADPVECRGDLDGAGPELGLGNLFDPNVFLAVEPCSLHCPLAFVVCVHTRARCSRRFEDDVRPRTFGARSRDASASVDSNR